MDYNRAFRFIFDDKDWLSKIGLGLLIQMVPILNFAWVGYQVQIIRNVRRNEAIILPTWDDLGKKFTDGLMLALAGILYALPIILIACLPLALIFIPMLAVENEDLFGALMAGSTLIYFSLFCVIFLYALALSILTPIMQIHYAEEGTFASCFKVREFFAVLGKHAGTFFTLWIIIVGVTIGVGIATGMVGGLIGWFPLIGQILLAVVAMTGSAYSVCFSSHLYGQFSTRVFEKR
jgi:hypothetical protein